MNPALQHVEPAVDQMPLIDPPAAVREPVRFSAWGELTRHAEVRVATDGSCLLTVQVMQPKGALPFVAVRHEPADRLSELRALAALMRPGVAVVIVGRGFELTHLDGHQAVRPRICDAIQLANFCFIDEGKPS